MWGPMRTRFLFAALAALVLGSQIVSGSAQAQDGQASIRSETRQVRIADATTEARTESTQSPAEADEPSRVHVHSNGLLKTILLGALGLVAAGGAFLWRKIRG
jgi:hypothetical protein